MTNWERVSELREEMRRVEGEYATAVWRMWDLYAADAPESQIDPAYWAAKDLQTTYGKIARQYYPQHDQSWVEREIIVLVPGRCRAIVIGEHGQCSRRATMQLGDLILCTQHYKLVDDPDIGYAWPDLFDTDGRGFAGHGVLDLFPDPWWWERTAMT